jgi:hypothetical protein
VANQVRPGLRWTFSPTLRPLRALEVEPQLSVGWLREGGAPAYRESATQVLAVWHFDARHNLRAILQRSKLERRAETGVDAGEGESRVQTLTYTWRRSAGTVLYLGATRARDIRPVASSTNEVFLKLQFDADEVLAAVSP